MEFAEIRSQKRALDSSTSKDSEGGKLLNASGIVDPTSGKILTVAEAIKLHILDIRSGEIVLISGEKMSLEKASEHNLIDPELANKLSDHLDAVRYELAEAENGNNGNIDTSEKRIKVTSTSIISASIQSTSSTPSKSNISNSNIKTIADAIKDGTVDPIKGIYKLSDDTSISITEAYQRGLLIKNESVKIKSTPLCLSDAIIHGLVDQAGWVIDRNAGDKFRLDSAIENQLIISDCQEVIDTRNDVKVTVAEAIESGLINPKTGRYVNPLTKEKLTFIEAKNRQLIARPMTLKDACDLNLLDREAHVFSPTRKRQLNILEAIKVGILDGDKIHSISKGDDSELLTLNEAIGQGIVRLNNNFLNVSTNELMSIQDAVDEGLIASVSQKSIFDIDAFKDSYSNEFLSLNEAISKGVLVKSKDDFKIDLGGNQLVSLARGIEMGCVRNEVHEMLNRRVGVFMNGNELTVFDLVLNDLIDPKSGYLIEKNAIVPLNDAIEKGIITPEGALLLSSLLNITLTTETLSKIEKRYITIAQTHIADYSENSPEDTGTFKLADAIEQNIFDPSTGIFTVPNTDRLVSFEECIRIGLINPESIKIIDPKYKEEISVHRALERNIIDSTGHYRSSDGWIPMNESIERGIVILEKPLSSSPSLMVSDDITSPEPLEISPGIFYDPSTALVINMKTGKSENIIQAVKDNLIDSKTVKIQDNSTGDLITIDDALKRDMISLQSGEIKDSTGRKISLIDAVKTGMLIVAGAPVVAAAGAINSLKLIFDPNTQQHIPVELAYERGLVSRDEISDFTRSESIPKSMAMISQTSSFDIPTPKDMASTPLKSRKHSTSDSNQAISVNEALQRGLLDIKNDSFLDPLSNESVSIQDAIQKGLLVASVPSDNVEDEIMSISPIHERMVKRKKSPEKIADDVDLAIASRPIPAKRMSIDKTVIERNENIPSDIKEIKEKSNKEIALVDKFSSVLTEKIPSLNLREASEDASSDSEKKNSSIIEKSNKIENLNKTDDDESKMPTHRHDDIYESREKSPLTKIHDENEPHRHDDFYDDVQSLAKRQSSPIDYKSFKLDQSSEESLPEAKEISEIPSNTSKLNLIVSEKDATSDAAISDEKHSSDELVEIQESCENSEITYSEKNVEENSQKLKQKDAAESTKINDESLPFNDDDVKNEKKTNQKAVKSTDVIETLTSSTKTSTSIITQQQQQHAEGKLIDDALKAQKDEKQSISQQHEKESQLGKDIANAAKLGLMAIVGAPVLAGMAVADSVKNIVKRSGNDESNSEKPSKIPEKMIFSTIQELSESIMSNKETKPTEVDEKLTPEFLESLGAFDKRTNSFVDPSSGDKVAFDDFLFNCGVFDPELIYVRDLNTDDKFLPLAVALEKLLIDKNTGMMVEPKTGKRIPFFECLQRKWIIQKEPEKVTSISLEDARNAGLLDEESGKIAVDGIMLPVSEALHSGVIEIDNISLRNSSGDIIPLIKAIEDGSVDLKQGTFTDNKSGEVKPLDIVFKEGNLLEGIKSPISLEAVITTGCYDKPSRKIKDDDKLLSIQAAIDQGVIDPNISQIKNTSEGKLIPLQTAIDEKLIEDDLIKDTASGTLLPLDDALKSHLISTKPIKMTLIDAIVREYYKADLQKILNPMNGQMQCIADAIKEDYLDISTTLIVDERNERVISAKDAINANLIDPIVGRLTQPDLNLKNAYERGYILNSKKPISLADALVRNMYDPLSGKLKPNDAEMSLEECIKNAEISTNDLIIHDPKTNNIISVSDAIKIGLIDARHGCVNEPQNNQKLTFNEAVDRGIIILTKRKCSLPEAVFKGLYDPSSGTFANTLTTEKLSTERAIKRGFIDPQSTVVNIGGKILPFELSVESGMVDTKRGTITDEYGNKIDFREAFDRGILVEVRKPIGLYEAIVKNIYNESCGLFMDPKTGMQLTLEQAITEKLIDPNSVRLKDNSIYRDISLIDALETGMIDDDSHVNVNARKLTLREAFDLGILCDSKAPISIQRAIHQGTYDTQTGKIIDHNTGKKMTLHEAMRRWIINPQLACYFDESEETLLSLSECCRLKMIDRREGVFREPGSNAFVSLSEALNLGLIVDIESGSFGVYEMLAMKLYDPSSGKFINPSNNCLITMSNAIENDLISPLCSFIKDEENNLYIKLTDAIKKSIIDTEKGVYMLHHSNDSIDLQEAKKRGLIVSHQKLLTLENAIAMGLFRSENGKFVDPSTNELLDLQACIDKGLIDGDSTILGSGSSEDSSLRKAIERGEIDVSECSVIDPNTGISSPLDVALNKGLLMTVRKPLTGERKSIARLESFENILKSEAVSNEANNSREISLGDAINDGLVDANSMFIKDPKTGQFQTLARVLSSNENLIDLSKKIDPSATSISIDENSVIYNRAPPESFESAVESGHLDLSNGNYHNPTLGIKSNLKDAIENGLIDPDSALIKDGAKGKLIRLPKAFRKGLIDSDKFNVIDTATSKLMPLQNAVDDAILVTPKRSLDLLDALQYNLYESSSGRFKDPFCSSSITLNDAIAKGLIDPSTTLVRDLENSQIAPLSTAISNGLIDPIGGRLMVLGENAENLDLLKARDKGLLLPAEQRVSNFGWICLMLLFLPYHTFM